MKKNFEITMANNMRLATAEELATKGMPYTGGGSFRVGQEIEFPAKEFMKPHWKEFIKGREAFMLNGFTNGNCDSISVGALTRLPYFAKQSERDAWLDKYPVNRDIYMQENYQAKINFLSGKILTVVEIVDATKPILEQGLDGKMHAKRRDDGTVVTQPMELPIFSIRDAE